jgi:hypothetical protein
MNLIVSNNTIKETAPFSNNVDETIIDKCNRTTQLVQVYEILGEDLYNRIQNELSSTVTPEIDKLIKEHLKYVISFSVYIQTLPFLHFKTREQGVVQLTSDTANTTNLDDMLYVKKSSESILQSFIIKLVKFLNDNIEDYPEFKKSVNCECVDKQHRTLDTILFSPKLPKNSRY